MKHCQEETVKELKQFFDMDIICMCLLEESIRPTFTVPLSLCGQSLWRSGRRRDGWMEEGAISRPVVNSEGGFAHRSLSRSGPPWRSNALMYCIGDVRLLRLRHQIPL